MVTFLTVVLGIAVGVWMLRIRANWLSDPLVPVSEISQGEKHDTLFVLVHGFAGSPETAWKSLGPRLLEFGDVLAVRCPMFPLSNADPDAVSTSIHDAVQHQWETTRHRKVVLIGHSMGALLARKAFLTGCRTARSDTLKESPENWANRVDRLVLLAGANRGVDIGGARPMDMNWRTYSSLWVSSWLGECTGTGRLARAMFSGSPFVANLRLDWMNWYRRPADDLKPPIIQLLGDIDDVVTEADSIDLQTSSREHLTCVKVRGTGHTSILDLDESTSDSGVITLGEYRAGKIEQAATASFSDLQRENEVQSFENDPEVTHVVFILHGIRDLGTWSAEFEYALRQDYLDAKTNQLPTLGPTDNPVTSNKLAIKSIRYGYFAMGPFLLHSNRQKFVRWFMDEYTQTLARYPRLTRIDFVGHSNGTYLLTSALQKYRSMRVDRVVFGGSVVRQDYGWNRLITDERVKQIRNYVACDDAVVGLLPRFFEPPLTAWLNPDLGSAGFNGFTEGADSSDFMLGSSQPIQNIKYITGGHSAFLNHVPAISEFLMSPKGVTAPPRNRSHGQYQNQRGGNAWLKWLSDWGCWALWLAAIVLIAAITFWSRQFGLPALAGVVILLLWVLYGV